MEQIPLPRPELEEKEPDDIRALIIKQEQAKITSTLEKIEKHKSQVESAEAILDAINGDRSTATIILELGFDSYDYDIYTYSSCREDLRQYSIRTDSLTEAMTQTAKYLMEQKIAHIDSFEPSIVSIGLAVDSTTIQSLESQQIEHWRQLFHTSLRESGFKKY